MLIKWKIPVDRTSMDPRDLDELGHKVMTCIGLDEDEFRTASNRVEGTMTVLTLSHFITPLRMSLYDVVIIPELSSGRVVVRFRLYKILVIAILFWLITGFLIGTLWELTNLALPLCIVVFFGGIALLTVSGLRKEVVELVQAWGKG